MATELSPENDVVAKLAGALQNIASLFELLAATIVEAIAGLQTEATTSPAPPEEPPPPPLAPADEPAAPPAPEAPAEPPASSGAMLGGQ